MTKHGIYRKLGACLGITALLLCLSMLLSGCQYRIWVQGVVLEWKNAPVGELGGIYIDKPLPSGAETAFIRNASIVVKYKGGDSWSMDVYYGDMQYYGSENTSPSKTKYIMTVSATNFYTLSQEFIYRPGKEKPVTKYFQVLMVKH
jgi:hypothetical protein